MCTFGDFCELIGTLATLQAERLASPPQVFCARRSFEPHYVEDDDDERDGLGAAGEPERERERDAAGAKLAIVAPARSGRLRDSL